MAGSDRNIKSDREPATKQGAVELDAEGLEPETQAAGAQESGAKSPQSEHADEEATRVARRRAKRAERRKTLAQGKKGGRSKLQVARKVALVGFGVVGAYLIAIYVDLLLKVFTLKHLDSFSPFVQRYVIAPIAFEGGFFVAQLLVLYLLGRFIELALWPTLISMVVLVHAFDFGVKYVLSQSSFNYANLRLWLVRLPLILLTFIVGRLVLRLALLRDEES